MDNSEVNVTTKKWKTVDIQEFITMQNRDRMSLEQLGENLKMAESEITDLKTQLSRKRKLAPHAKHRKIVSRSSSALHLRSSAPMPVRLAPSEQSASEGPRRIATYVFVCL